MTVMNRCFEAPISCPTRAEQTSELRVSNKESDAAVSQAVTRELVEQVKMLAACYGKLSPAIQHKVGQLFLDLASIQT